MWEFLNVVSTSKASTQGLLCTSYLGLLFCSGLQIYNPKKSYIEGSGLP